MSFGFHVATVYRYFGCWKVITFSRNEIFGFERRLQCNRCAYWLMVKKFPFFIIKPYLFFFSLLCVCVECDLLVKCIYLGIVFSIKEKIICRCLINFSGLNFLVDKMLVQLILFVPLMVHYINHIFYDFNEIGPSLNIIGLRMDWTRSWWILGLKSKKNRKTWIMESVSKQKYYFFSTNNIIL